MKTKLHYVLTTTIFLMVFSTFAQDSFFVKVGKEQKTTVSKSTTNSTPIYEFDYEALHNALPTSTTTFNTSKSSAIIFSFPNSNGTLEKYEVKEASVMHSEMQEKYPEIRSYVAYGIDTPSAVFRFSLSPYKGLSGIVLGKEFPEIVEPVLKHSNQFKVSNEAQLESTLGFNCSTVKALQSLTRKSQSNLDIDDSIKRVYTLALSVTGEYSSFHGSTLPTVNAALVSTLTNINAVFENDLNIALVLAADNDKVIYTDTATDPYSGFTNYGRELQNTLDTEIGDLNYDVGHLLSGIGFDGNAGCIGCVCNSGIKGRGYTSSSNPNGYHFDIDLVAHEIGHQFGANHTWTHEGNEGTNVQVEPGSGSTIMGYAGIAKSANVQVNSDPYFHGISIEQISAFIKTTSCAVETNTGNTTPNVDAGSDLVLPIGTPFKLVGSANDTDGDNITYCWEQIDENNALTTFPDPNLRNSDAVLFRSFPPTTSNTRYFPNLSDLRYGVNAGQWEKVPNVGRTADFRLTVRDNRNGGANNRSQDIRVTFNESAGPLTITSQNTPGLFWVIGATETITWNVNNTNTLPGAANVNILLSTDGGVTYSPVANNVPNNGSYNLTVPNTPARQCRIMVEAAGNNFFAINTEDFAIDFEVTTTCTRYSSSNNLNIDIDDNTGNLSASDVITINDASTITDINLGVNISHNFIGDLAILLQAPDGSTVVLKTPTDCESERNLINIYDDQAIAFNCQKAALNTSQRSVNELLSTFNGKNTSGDWTIRIGDFQPGDSGVLNSWFLEVCQTESTTLNIFEFSFDKVKLYPNPNDGRFTLSIDRPHIKKNISVDIFDVRGRQVYKKTLNETTRLDETIQLENTQSGMYIFRLTDGISTDVRRIIVN